MVYQTETGTAFPTPRTNYETFQLLDYLTLNEINEKRMLDRYYNDIYYAKHDFFNPMKKNHLRTLRNLNAVCWICGSS
jgi:hypothetical protein